MLAFIKKIILRDIIRFPLLRHSPILGRRYISKGLVAKNILYGDVSKDMFVIGITGTDGKTTTCNIIHKVICDNLGKAAMISTAGLKIGDQIFGNDSKKTSLDILDLYKFLSQAKAEKCTYAVIEVSSHGLSQYRFRGIDFNLGALTNITPEHMDYHKTMEEYANIKKKLFTGILSNPVHPKMAVLPKDDEFGRKWFEELLFDKSLDFGIKNNAALRAENIITKIDSTDYTIKYLGVDYPITTRLCGQFNVYNALATTGIGLLLGIEIQNIIKSISNFETVNGRMNIYKHDNRIYIVDFAHTPKALESVLTYLTSIKGKGRIVTLFGAPGERDVYKRPQMGQIVNDMSDVIILTEDDSMSENTDNIIKQTAKGINRQIGDNYFIINDRAQAIKLTTEISKPGDIILLAGKGHENYLYTNFGKYPHNDMEYLKSIIPD